MAVSGLGSASWSHSHVSPVHRAGRVARPAAAEGSDFDHLTAGDRELIFQATGQRLGPGFDPAKHVTTGFAAVLAAERANGHLLPGQEITSAYLKDLDYRYARGGTGNPMALYLDKAVGFLSRNGVRRFDVSA